MTSTDIKGCINTSKWSSLEKAKENRGVARSDIIFFRFKRT